MASTQRCARWGCEKEASYDKPLCYPHWQAGQVGVGRRLVEMIEEFRAPLRLLGLEA